jgi:polysaccharide biosynthesis PFTS motif protein
MRGYKLLREESNLPLIQKIKDELSETPILVEYQRDKKSTNSIDYVHLELSVRQYLINHLLYKASRNNFFIGISCALLAIIGKKGKLRYPLPSPWRKVIRNHGIQIDSFWCSFLWIMFLISMLFYGIRNLVVRLRFLLKFKGIDTLGRQSIFFTGLNAEEVKTFRNNKNSILYKAIGDKKVENIILIHDNKQIEDSNDGLWIRYAPLPILKHTNPALLISLFVSLIYSAINSFINLLIGRWWYAVLLSETVDAKIVSKLSGNQDGNLFFFDQARFIYRPIWTYSVEKMNGNVILYFYSTNNEYIETKDFNYSCKRKWSIMSWPIYWVWDQYQEKFIRNAVGNNCKVEIKGAIISGHNLKVHTKSNEISGAIAVFDVQPVRDSFYQSIALPQEYIVPDVTNSFLKDIATVLEKNKLRMLYKSKREIGKLAHYQHRIVVNDLDKKGHLQFIDPNASAINVIKSSLATISFPYTSTALLGRDENKPSVYYDPTGLVIKSNKATCEIPVLCGKKELEQWVQNLVSENNVDAN